MHFQKKVIVCYILELTVLEILEFQGEDFLKFSLIVLTNVYSDPYKQYHFLKECKENFQMQYLNCFNILRFLAEIRTNCKTKLFYTI